MRVHDSEQERATGKWLSAAILILSAVAMAINGWLLSRHLAGDGIAGCGGGNCDELLNSRWSQVFLIPVTVFGMLTYLGLMVAIVRQRWSWLGCGMGCVVGAVGWFVIVQAVIVGHFCPWCMTAHGIGVVVVGLGAWLWSLDEPLSDVLKQTCRWALAGGLAICLAQVFGPQPVTYRVEKIAGGGQSSASAHAPDARVVPHGGIKPEASVPARGSGPVVTFLNGEKRYDVGALPHLGPAGAKRVLVEYFDFTCAACRTMFGFLETLMAKYPADICVIVLPVPMERACNPAMAIMDPDHAGACETAKLALALWRGRPEAYAGLHPWLMQEHPVAEVRAKVLEMMPEATLAEALKDPWIAQWIAADVRDWKQFSESSLKLPKLLISNNRVLHGLPSGEADFIRVMERELGL